MAWAPSGDRCDNCGRIKIQSCGKPPAYCQRQLVELWGVATEGEPRRCEDIPEPLHLGACIYPITAEGYKSLVASCLDLPE